jgi:2-polyprenyl-3-methyl-5-hydroxy-6-metoxy-1,4-benzoquinol methylase
MTALSPDSGEQKLLPQKILDMNYAFARTAILVAAVRLHLFTCLADKSLTATELAAQITIAPESAQRLLRSLETLELVAKEAEVYRLTPIARQFLVEGQPSYLGGDTLAMMDYIPAWFELDRTLQTSVPYRDLGNAATAEAFFAPRVLDLFPLIFPIASKTASELSLGKTRETALQVLDIGAGSAPWSAAFALQYPAAHVTALDLPEVVEQGRQKIDSLDFKDRYTWIKADMEDYTLPPLAHDLILCGHVCRFIGDERVKTLFARLAESLRPGGTLLVADIFLAEDSSRPSPAPTLDLSMLVNTAQGRIRTVNEMAQWLRENSLQDVQRFHVAGPFPLLIARKEER